MVCQIFEAASMVGGFLVPLVVQNHAEQATVDR